MQLKIRVAAMLAAAVAFVPSMVSAADFITIRVDVVGTGTKMAYRDFQGQPTPYTLTSGVASYFEVTLPLGVNNANSSVPVPLTINNFNYFVPNQADTREFISGGVNSNSFSLVDTLTPATRGTSRSFSVSGCLPGIGTTGSFSVALDTSCSMASYRLAGGGTSTLPTVIEFSGVATRLTVTEGTGTPAFYGVTSAVIDPVPEPASWAMMIVGVAAIGGMARRRRPVAVAA